MEKIPVGILGATGMVGQRYVHLLSEHPQFEIAFLASSSHSSGKTYGEAVEGRWHGQGAIPSRVSSLILQDIASLEEAKKNCAFVFSAVGAETAGLYEELYAQQGLAVVSNASYHRLTQDVPLLIPEVNPHHLQILPIQRQNRGWKKGFIVAKPNCSLQSYLIPLFPLHQKFQVRRLIITTLQAMSGAGYPGVSSLDITDNVIPHIHEEEQKSEQEPLKIWGHIEGGRIVSASHISIAAHCNRVPVIDGHLVCVSVEFEEKPTQEQILKEWADFRGLPQELGLPSAPAHPIVYRKEPDRPQPRLDRLAGDGMAVSVGRLRKCPVFDFRFVALSHNTVRGAAGGGILNAELLLNQGYLL